MVFQLISAVLSLFSLPSHFAKAGHIPPSPSSLPQDFYVWPRLYWDRFWVGNLKGALYKTTVIIVSSSLHPVLYKRLNSTTPLFLWSRISHGWNSTTNTATDLAILPSPTKRSRPWWTGSRRRHTRPRRRSVPRPRSPCPTRTMSSAPSVSMTTVKTPMSSSSATGVTLQYTRSATGFHTSPRASGCAAHARRDP